MDELEEPFKSDKQSENTKEEIESLSKYENRIKRISSTISMFEKKLQTPEANQFETKFRIIHEELKIAYISLAIHNYYEATSTTKNYQYIKEVRIKCSKCLDILESIMQELSEDKENNDEFYEKLEKVPIANRLNLTKELGFLIDVLKQNGESQEKIKWLISGFISRLASIAKKSFNPKELSKKMDPFQNRQNSSLWVEFASLVAKILQEAAIYHRKKYEVFLRNESDFLKAIDFLEDLSLFYFWTGEIEKRGPIKKQIEVWNQKFKQDIKNEFEKPRGHEQ